MAESASGNDVEMSVGEPEVEIEDIYVLMNKLDNCIQESKTMNDKMERVWQNIKTNISKQEELNQRKARIEAEAGIYSEKLSQTAVELISNIEGPLTPEIFLRFLMGEVYGKPNPSVLPILRRLSTDVEGIKKQLFDLKKQLESKHKDYKEERRKDENLETRIKKLIENIDKELKVENRDGMKQMSMENFLRVE